MCVSADSTKSRYLIVLGAGLLAIASSTPLLLRHTGGLSETIVDPLTGLLFGMAIGMMILGLRVRRRTR